MPRLNRMADRGASIEHSNAELLIRAMLLVAAVIACHLMRWEWLRFWTSEAVLRLCDLLAVPMHRLLFDTVKCRGQMFDYSVSCTFIDVCFGAIVLMWNRARSLSTNLLTMAAFAGCLFIFNVVRLALGFVLYSHRVPWTIAHEAMSGVAYFLVWLYLMRQLGDPIARFIERGSSQGRLAMDAH
jgi:hypothetical protein